MDTAEFIKKIEKSGLEKDVSTHSVSYQIEKTKGTEKISYQVIILKSDAIIEGTCLDNEETGESIYTAIDASSRHLDGVVLTNKTEGELDWVEILWDSEKETLVNNRLPNETKDAPRTVSPEEAKEIYERGFEAYQRVRQELDLDNLIGMDMTIHRHKTE